MKRRKIRCYVEDVFVENEKNKIYFYMQDGWNLSLAICSQCGEIFAINFENPKTHNLCISDIGNGLICPNCSYGLGDTLKNIRNFF
jgi:hypothetical protein